MKRKRMHFDRDIPLLSLARLPQIRQDFNHIEELISSILSFEKYGGLLEPIGVAMWNKESLQDYLRLVNFVSGSHKRVSQFTPHDDGLYYVLLFGERRYRASIALYQHGCSGCRRKKKNLPAGECYTYHFDGTTIRATVYPDIPVDIAVKMQLEENSYIIPPPQDFAIWYRRMYAYLSKTEALTVREFAKRYHRNEKTIEQALAYANLPAEMRRLVDVGKITYGVGVELALYRETSSATKESLKSLCDHAMIYNWTRAQCREAVQFRISSDNGASLFEMGGTDEIESMRCARVKSAQKITGSLYAGISYMKRILSFINEGVLNGDHSPFTIDVTLIILGKLVDVCLVLIPHLRRLRPRMIKKLDRYDLVLTETRNQVERLLKE